MNKIELIQQLKMSNLKIKSIQDRFIKTPIRMGSYGQWGVQIML